MSESGKFGGYFVLLFLIWICCIKGLQMNYSLLTPVANMYDNRQLNRPVFTSYGQNFGLANKHSISQDLYTWFVHLAVELGPI